MMVPVPSRLIELGLIPDPRLPGSISTSQSSAASPVKP
jgi:hypothetical protein